MTSALHLSVFCSFVYMCAAPNVGLKPGYCVPGYFGVFCADICPYPYYGKLCDHTCTCLEQQCNHVNGCILVSSCPSGYIGSYCDTKCTYPAYGHGCQQKCLCPEKVCHFSTGCQRKIANSKTLSSPKTLPITKGTTNENYLIPMSNTTVWTRGHSAESRIDKRTNADHVETTSQASLESKSTNICPETNERGPGKSSGLFSFIRNREMKASIVVLCVLFVLLVIAHILISIVQRIKVKNNAVPV